MKTQKHLLLSFVCVSAAMLVSGCCVSSKRMGLASPPTKTQVEVLAQSTSSWDDALLPAYPQGQPEVSILRITIPAGARLPMHLHPVINAGVLLEGELTIYKESGETRHLKEGEALIEVVDQWHYGSNEGNTPAVILVFYAGAEGMPLSISKPNED